MVAGQNRQQSVQIEAGAVGQKRMMAEQEQTEIAMKQQTCRMDQVDTDRETKCSGERYMIYGLFRI